MKFTLKDYQEDAVEKILDRLRKSRRRWHEDKEQNAFSLTATTGAGKTVIERLMRSIGFRRVPPSQTIADNVDNSADDTAVVDTRLAVGSREVGLDTLKLSFGQPAKIGHGQFLLPI